MPSARIERYAEAIADPMRRESLGELEARALAEFRATVRYASRGRLDAQAIEIGALQAVLEAHRQAAGRMWAWVPSNTGGKRGGAVCVEGQGTR